MDSYKESAVEPEASSFLFHLSSAYVTHNATGLPTDWCVMLVASGGGNIQILYFSKSINTTITSKSPSIKMLLK